MEQVIEITAGNVKLFIPGSELMFRTSRSSGPGGQNVNKLETKVELEFDVRHSSALSRDQKQTLTARLGSRINSMGILRVVAQESRSQWSNREKAVEKFVTLLTNALKPRKKRLPTHPGRAARERRLQTKKKHSEKKRMRRSDSD